MGRCCSILDWFHHEGKARSLEWFTIEANVELGTGGLNDGQRSQGHGCRLWIDESR